MEALMPWYVDSRLIVNTEYLIEAHCVDGAEAFDGLYGITYTIKHADVMRDIIVTYTERSLRDAAFTALGLLTKTGDVSHGE